MLSHHAEANENLKELREKMDNVVKNLNPFSVDLLFLMLSPKDVRVRENVNELAQLEKKLAGFISAIDSINLSDMHNIEECLSALEKNVRGNLESYNSRDDIGRNYIDGQIKLKYGDDEKISNFTQRVALILNPIKALLTNIIPKAELIINLTDVLDALGKVDHPEIGLKKSQLEKVIQELKNESSNSIHQRDVLDETKSFLSGLEIFLVSIEGELKSKFQDELAAAAAVTQLRQVDPLLVDCQEIVGKLQEGIKASSSAVLAADRNSSLEITRKLSTEHKRSVAQLTAKAPVDAPPTASMPVSEVSAPKAHDPKREEKKQPPITNILEGGLLTKLNEYHHLWIQPSKNASGLRKVKLWFDEARKHEIDRIGKIVEIAKEESKDAKLSNSERVDKILILLTKDQTIAKAQYTVSQLMSKNKYTKADALKEIEPRYQLYIRLQETLQKYKPDIVVAEKSNNDLQLRGIKVNMNNEINEILQEIRQGITQEKKPEIDKSASIANPPKR